MSAWTPTLSVRQCVGVESCVAVKICHDAPMNNQPSICDVQNPTALDAMCQTLADAPALFIDTEFHRETTYWPQFALMQISARDGDGVVHCYLIDPLALEDLAPLWKLLTNPEQTKVFHAGSQDLEIIYRLCGKLPLPLFDTQVAAALLGLGQQIGFGALVQQLTGVTLGKGSTFSDWMQRPLTKTQRQYAADDVLHLMPVYAHLHEQLQARGRLDWLDDEQRVLTDPGKYETDLATVFWRTKGCNRLKPKQLAILRSLAAWREQAAQQRNIPRRRMIGDEPMLELARQTELDMAALTSIRGISGGLVKRFGKELLAAWQQGNATPKEEWPRVQRSPSHSAGSAIRAELLDSLVQLKADELDISSSILAKKSELAALASWGGGKSDTPPELALLSGWRRRLIGEELLQMLAGKLLLKIDPETKLPVILPV
ncbi:MAG: ribonuclease D [Mariprofundales bacterium]|nr:ribonuclease D [Mariprofundales bacterium]